MDDEKIDLLAERLDKEIGDLDKIRVDLLALREDTGEEPEEPSPVPVLTAKVTYVDDDAIVITWSSTVLPESLRAGRDGNDDSNHGPWESNYQVDASTVRFDKLLPDTEYNLQVQATYPGGAVKTVSMKTRTSKAIVTPIPQPGAGKMPVVNRSKFAGDTNIVYFRSGVDTLAQLTARETYLGYQLDGIMKFIPRETEGEMLGETFWKQMGEIAATGRIVVIAMPWAPATHGSSMNRNVAKGDYVSFHRKLAALIVKYGLNRANVVIRLAWEYNGNWYAWSALDGNGGAATFKAAWKMTVDTFRANGADKVLWDQCANKGPQANNKVTAEDVFIDGYVDIVGVDSYNFWPAQNNAGGWNTAINQVPGIVPNSNLALKKNVAWSVDEWGPANPANGGSHGGDSRFYSQSMVDIVKARKAAMFVLYDDGGAPASLNHSFDSNPHIKAVVKESMV